jgi:predicted nucleotidyltransferase
MKNKFDHLSKREQEAVQSFVKELRERLGNVIISVRLFGSKVRGDFKEDSDVDIFILVKKKTPAIVDIVGDLAADYIYEYDIPLSTVLYDLFEYSKNKELGSFFVENVEKQGIAL